MSHIVSKLKALKLQLYDDLLVHLVLISLPVQYIHFKVSYITQKDKWTLIELISPCVQEDERIKRERIESANLATAFTENEEKKLELGHQTTRSKRNHLQKLAVSFVAKRPLKERLSPPTGVSRKVHFSI